MISLPPTSPRFAVLTTAVLLGLLSIGTANAQLTTNTWSSSSNSTWNLATNWSLNSIPNAGTVLANISTGAGTNVTLDTSPTLGGLSVASGYTLQRASTDTTSRVLTIGATTASNTFFSNAGTISSGGTSGTLTLRFNGGGSTFVNSGTMQATTGTTLELRANNATTLPTLNNTNGTIQTLGTGTLRITSWDIPSGQPAGLQAISGGTLSISSGGTMTHDGGDRALTLANVAFNNNGTVTWVQGTTTRGSSVASVITLSGTTALVNNGTMQFTRDGAFNTFANSQSGLTLNSATASLSNSVGANINFLAKGSIGGQANLTTFNANSTITNNGTITFESQSSNSSSMLTVGATGANSLTLGGSGTLVLRVATNGSASMTGITGSTANFINGTTHTIRGAGAIGLGGMRNVVNNGTITADDANNALTLNMAFAANDNTQIGNFVNNGTLQATGAGGFVINAGNVVNNGTFTTASNSPFTMNRGFLLINNAGKTMTIGGAWISGTGGGSVIQNDGTITYDSATTSSNQIGQTGSGAFIKSGTGSLTLTGANNNTGSTTVNGGTLFVNTNAATALRVSNVAGPTVTLTSGTTAGLVVGQWDGQGYIDAILTSTTYLRTGPATTPGSTNITAAAYQTLSSGSLTLNGGTLDLGTGSHTVGQVTLAGGSITNGTLTTTAANIDGQSGSVSATMAGASKTLTKSTAGTLILSGSNSYTGTTTISAGSLQLGNGGSTGSLATSSAIVNNGNLSINRSNAVSQGTDLSGAAITGTGSFTQAGTGTTTLTAANTYTGTTTVNGGTLQLGAGGSTGSLATSSAIVNNGNLSINRSNAVSQGTDFSGAAITGTGSFTQAGTGTTTLTAANTYNGGTTVSAGTLALSGGANRLNTAGSVSVSSGATLNLGGFNQTLAGLTGSGSVTNSTGALTLNVGSGNNTFAGSIAGAGGFTKIGNGSVTLTGTSTYSGATAISAGLLTVNGTSTSSAIAVNSTGTLGGSGSVGAVTVASGGTIAPGNSPGTLTVASSIWNAGGNYNWQLYDAAGTAGSSWDVVNVNGLLDLSALASGNKFNINLWTLSATNSDVNGNAINFNPSNSSSWNIANYGTISGFSADLFNINFSPTNGTDGFSNAIDPNGSFSITSSNNALWLNYVAAAPSNSVLGLLGISFANGTNAIITGGSNAFTVSVTNGPGANSALTFTGTNGSNVSGSIASTTVAAGATTNAAGLAYTGIDVGTNVGSFTLTAPGASNSPVIGSVTNLVYDHASGSLASNVISVGNVHVGYSNALSGSVTASNASGFRVNLAGDSLSSNGTTLSGISGVAAGGVTNVTATVGTGLSAGAISNNFTYTFKDDSTLSGASANVGTTNITVTGFVYTGQGVWNTNGGSWATFANWQQAGGTPGIDGDLSVNDTATFGTGGSGSVTLDGVSPSLQSVTFSNSSASYTIAPGAGSATLTLKNGDVAASISNQAGSHLISAALNLVSDLTLNSASNTAMNISGAIGGVGGLTKTGSGTATLSAANTFSGDTLVSAGTLIISGGTTNSATTVDDSGTLGGIGSLGAVIVQSGGTLAPSIGWTTGQMSVDSLALESGSTVNMLLTGTNAGAYDSIFSKSTQTIGFGGRLNVTLTGTDYNDSNKIGLFQLFSTGAGITGGGVDNNFSQVFVTYGDYSGNLDYYRDVNRWQVWDKTSDSYIGLSMADGSFLVIPEPSTYALLGLGALVMVIAYRRRAEG